MRTDPATSCQRQRLAAVIALFSGKTAASSGRKKIDKKQRRVRSDPSSVSEKTPSSDVFLLSLSLSLTHTRTNANKSHLKRETERGEEEGKKTRFCKN
jgi:hypothetical protein